MAIQRILKDIFAAKRDHGASIFRQVFEILYLRMRRRSQLGVSEYFEYSLFDSEKYSFTEKLEFCGHRLKSIIDAAANSQNSHILSTDKLIFYTLASNLKIQVPELYGVFSESGRAVYAGSCFTSREGLANFLLDEVRYPFFAKPIHSWHGIGGLGITRIDDDKKCFVTFNGCNLPFDEFIDTIMQHKSGYLFQSAATPHTEIGRVSGGRVCSLRCVVFRVGAKFNLHRVVWKIATGRNMTDNFAHGSSGNFLAKIDPITGIVEKAFHKFGLNEVSAVVHPDTGMSITGFQLPMWSQVKGSLEHASMAFPCTKLQAWDVVITDDGPLFLEMSVPMDLDLVQFGAECGFWDVKFDTFLKSLSI